VSDPLSQAIGILDLDNTSARTSEDIFVGHSGWIPNRRVFGGQVLGQSVVAAQRTIEGRPIHSLHGYFLRPGDIELPITFAVDRIHDGRSFSTRRIQAYQEGRPIFSMIASFQREEEGLDHQVEMPAGIPAPENLPTLRESVAEGAEHPMVAWTLVQAFEFRPLQVPVYLAIEGERVASQAVWMRAIGPVGPDPQLHSALLAYASDYNLLHPVLRRHGISVSTPGLRMASLDHAMWFHRQARVDQWMLYAHESPNTAGGRGLAYGRIFSRDGTLLASAAQEGMVRVPSSEPSP
jgi:acyl-CoA thioesterase-2